MHHDHDLAAVFHAILTDPNAAVPLLSAFSETERHALVFTATENAILWAFPTAPKPPEIRFLASHMRKIFDEPIDSHAIATTISTAFDPDNPILHRRLDAIDRETKRRMAFLLPHALYLASQPSPSEIDTWLQDTTTKYEQAMQILTANLGPDMGGFYRIVCINPYQATAYLNADTTMTAEEKGLMVITAAVTALTKLFPDSDPTTPARERLIDHLHKEHDGFPTEVLHKFLHHTLIPDQHPDFEDMEFDDDSFTVAILLPSAVAALTRMTSVDIGIFAEQCHATTTSFNNATTT